MYEDKHMNKLIITLFSAALLIAAGNVFAEDSFGGPGHKGKRQQRGMQGMPVVGQLMRGLRRLDLSEEQRESVHTIMQDMQAEVRPIMGKMRTNHMQLKELIAAEAYDEAAVTDLAQKEGELVAQRIMIGSKAAAEVLSQLTTEQRDELAAMGEQRREQRRERRERWLEDS
jgi:protein CpxP